MGVWGRPRASMVGVPEVVANGQPSKHRGSRPVFANVVRGAVSRAGLPSHKCSSVDGPCPSTSRTAGRRGYRERKRRRAGGEVVRIGDLVEVAVGDLGGDLRGPVGAVRSGVGLVSKWPHPVGSGRDGQVRQSLDSEGHEVVDLPELSGGGVGRIDRLQRPNAVQFVGVAGLAVGVEERGEVRDEGGREVAVGRLDRLMGGVAAEDLGQDSMRRQPAGFTAAQCADERAPLVGRPDARDLVGGEATGGEQGAPPPGRGVGSQGLSDWLEAVEGSGVVLRTSQRPGSGDLDAGRRQDAGEEFATGGGPRAGRGFRHRRGRRRRRPRRRGSGGARGSSRRRGLR